MPNRSWESDVEDFDVEAAAARGGVDLVEYYGEELRADCPFCDDTRQRLGVNSRTKLWHCFNCDSAGNLTGFLMRVLGITYTAAVELIVAGRSRRPGLDELQARPRARARPRPPARVLPAEFEPLTLPETPRNRRFWKYLRGRRYDPDLIQQYGIGFARSGFCAWRIIVPINVAGQLASYVARAVDDSMLPKYRSMPGANNADLIFNLERLAGRDEVVLMEGVFDALRLPDLAVATLGAHLSLAQHTLLLRAGFARAILCWDADDTGQPKAYEAARALRGRIDVLQALLPEGRDPGKMAEADLLAAIRAAAPPVGVGAFRRPTARERSTHQPTRMRS